MEVGRGGAYNAVGARGEDFEVDERSRARRKHRDFVVVNLQTLV